MSQASGGLAYLKLLLMRGYCWFITFVCVLILLCRANKECQDSLVKQDIRWDTRKVYDTSLTDYFDVIAKRRKRFGGTFCVGAR